MSSGLKVNTPVVINSKRIQISRKVTFSNHCLDSGDSGHRFAGKRHPWKTKLDIVFKLVKVSRYSKDWYGFTFTAGFSLNEVKREYLKSQLSLTVFIGLSSPFQKN